MVAYLASGGSVWWLSVALVALLLTYLLWPQPSPPGDSQQEFYWRD